MSNIYEVKNPVYQDYGDIEKQYEENMIVMTNVKRDKNDRIIGGIVRYYGRNREAITNKWSELRKNKKYDECNFRGLFFKTNVELYPLGPGGMYL